MSKSRELSQLANIVQVSSDGSTNLTPTSDGIIDALGYTPQDSSTAITSTNIGSQSVSYASDAGTLDTHDSTYFATASGLSSHTGNTSNPHSVTAAQVGAYTTGSVDTLLAGKVTKTSSTGSAAVPSGTTGERDGSPSAGYFRFNSPSVAISASGVRVTQQGVSLDLKNFTGLPADSALPLIVSPTTGKITFSSEL